MSKKELIEKTLAALEKLSAEKISDNEKIEKAFRLIICRNAKNKELEILLAYFENEKKKFQQSAAKAENFLQAGEYRHEKITDKATAAALMQVVHTIYNMEEAITK